MGSIDQDAIDKANEIMAVEMARVGITTSTDELVGRTNGLEWGWDYRPARQIVEYTALNSLGEARKCFREWAEKAADLERLFCDGKRHMETAAERLAHAALLPEYVLTGKKPGEA